jgi:phosphatidylinositol alpha-1,6-mannosyltransferase
VTRQLIRRVGASVDVLTYLGEYTRSRIAGAVGPEAASRMVRLTPGVDTDVFRPDAGGDEVRKRLGLAGRPVVVCVSRLMPRKGQDTLIKAWPAVKAQVPDAALLLVGGGPYRKTLERLVREGGLEHDVVMTGSVPWAELPAYYGAGDVFAMPCRTRNRGLDVEGLGIVYLEASACGLPVIAGSSGGAPDAIDRGVTGDVVDGATLASVAHPLIKRLTDSSLRLAEGLAGRKWVTTSWSWEVQAQSLSDLLAMPDQLG